MPASELAVVLVREDGLLTLVAGQPDPPAEVLGDGVLEAPLAQEGVDGLQLGPALFPCHLRQVGGCLHPCTHRELNLNPMTPNLCVCVCMCECVCV